jgi:NAD-dependent dihydropyrimidine dehydrogenase PreA subunit
MSVIIDQDLCENTGCCAMVCPEDVLEHENGRTMIVDQAKCTECWICVDNCVAGAVTVD